MENTMKEKVKQTAIYLLTNFWLIPFTGIIILISYLSKLHS
jgi:hypothetical protein